MQRNNPDVFKFYHSWTWLKVKEAYKKYRYGLCERCGNPRIYRASQILHKRKQHLQS